MPVSDTIYSPTKLKLSSRGPSTTTVGEHVPGGSVVMSPLRYGGMGRGGPRPASPPRLAPSTRLNLVRTPSPRSASLGPKPQPPSSRDLVVAAPRQQPVPTKGRSEIVRFPEDAMRLAAQIDSVSLYLPRTTTDRRRPVRENVRDSVVFGGLCDNALAATVPGAGDAPIWADARVVEAGLPTLTARMSAVVLCRDCIQLLLPKTDILVSILYSDIFKVDVEQKTRLVIHTGFESHRQYMLDFRGSGNELVPDETIAPKLFTILSSVVVTRSVEFPSRPPVDYIRAQTELRLSEGFAESTGFQVADPARAEEENYDGCDVYELLADANRSEQQGRRHLQHGQQRASSHSQYISTMGTRGAKSLGGIDAVVDYDGTFAPTTGNATHTSPTTHLSREEAARIGWNPMNSQLYEDGIVADDADLSNIDSHSVAQTHGRSRRASTLGMPPRAGPHTTISSRVDATPHHQQGQGGGEVSRTVTASSNYTAASSIVAAAGGSLFGSPASAHTAHDDPVSSFTARPASTRAPTSMGDDFSISPQVIRAMLDRSKLLNISTPNTSSPLPQQRHRNDHVPLATPHRGGSRGSNLPPTPHSYPRSLLRNNEPEFVFSRTMPQTTTPTALPHTAPSVPHHEPYVHQPHADRHVESTTTSARGDSGPQEDMEAPSFPGTRRIAPEPYDHRHGSISREASSSRAASKSVDHVRLKVPLSDVRRAREAIISAMEMSSPAPPLRTVAMAARNPSYQQAASPTQAAHPYQGPMRGTPMQPKLEPSPQPSRPRDTITAYEEFMPTSFPSTTRSSVVEVPAATSTTKSVERDDVGSPHSDRDPIQFDPPRVPLTYRNNARQPGHFPPSY